MQANHSKLSLALQLAKEGWRVFPISAGQKAPPLISAWQHRASDSEYWVRQWWGKRWPDANVGLRTGRYGARYVVVVDIDPEKDGETWLAENRDLFVPTYVVISGSGGKHFYYWTNTEHRDSQSKIAPGVDVRGEGGYVLPAGADHPSGGVYRVGCSLPVSDMPAELEAALLPPQLPAALPPAVPAPVDERPSAETLLRWALDQVRVGNRDNMGFKLARQLLANGIVGVEAERWMCEYARRVPQGGKGNPYTEADAKRNLFSAMKHPILPPWPAKQERPPRQQSVSR